MKAGSAYGFRYVQSVLLRPGGDSTELAFSCSLFSR
jgi:hypothetical protein